MEVCVEQYRGVPCALVHSDEVLIHDGQSALDLLATVRYETGCERMVLQKEAIAEDFFRLSSGLAGEVLQKFINYQTKLAVVGDFSRYTSKPLHDFMAESNRGQHIFFVPTEAEALERLALAQIV